MEPDLDVNKLTAEFLQANMEGAWSLITSQAKLARNMVRSKFERTYRSYLERILERYSRGKSFFVRSEPVPLYEFFVPLDLATQRRVLRKPSAADVAKVAPRIIVTGSGGSGKTMMMRHMLISAIAERSKTPVFIELRQLNQSEEGVRLALSRNLKANGLDVDDDYLEMALTAGHFSVMLDGFDELQYSRRKSVAREIQELAERYPRNWYVTSSRPDPQLEGWGPFVQFQIAPLDLGRAVELVEKVPFDDDVKTKFVAALRTGLFNRHRSFLSNPLLLSIMLLTYRDVAHIPNKLSIFYSQAYESLFQKHDALKGGFQRDRRSALDIQDFERAFAAFCIQSYDARELSFSQSRALEILDSGRKITQLAYEPRALLEDALQAVCLLVEEGLEITFAHRSFQEYFAARFIYSCPPEAKSKLIKRLTLTAQSDTVMALLHEMDQYAVEEYYVLPAIEDLKRRIKLVRNVGVTHFLRYLKSVWVAFNPGPAPHGIGGMPADHELLGALHFAWARYAEKPEGMPEGQIEAVRKAIIAAASEPDPAGWFRVATRPLSTRDELVRLLFDSTGVWGAEFLRDLTSIESRIRRRHKDAQSSLQAILAGDRRR